jgi:hypothetical protein
MTEAQKKPLRNAVDTSRTIVMGAAIGAIFLVARGWGSARAWVDSVGMRTRGPATRTG